MKMKWKQVICHIWSTVNPVTTDRLSTPIPSGGSHSAGDSCAAGGGCGGHQHSLVHTQQERSADTGLVHCANYVIINSHSKMVAGFNKGNIRIGYTDSLANTSISIHWP